MERERKGSNVTQEQPHCGVLWGRMLPHACPAAAAPAKGSILLEGTVLPSLACLGSVCRGKHVQLGGPGSLSELGIRSAALNHQSILCYWFLACLSVLIKVKNNNTVLHAEALLTTPQLPLHHRFPGCWGGRREGQTA